MAKLGKVKQLTLDEEVC